MNSDYIPIYILLMNIAVVLLCSGIGLFHLIETNDWLNHSYL